MAVKRRSSVDEAIKEVKMLRLNKNPCYSKLLRLEENLKSALNFVAEVRKEFEEDDTLVGDETDYVYGFELININDSKKRR